MTTKRLGSNHTGGTSTIRRTDLKPSHQTDAQLLASAQRDAEKYARKNPLTGRATKRT